MWYASSCSGTTVTRGASNSAAAGTSIAAAGQMLRARSAVIALSQQPSVAEFMRRILEDVGYHAIACCSTVDDFERVVDEDEQLLGVGLRPLPLVVAREDDAGARFRPGRHLGEVRVELDLTGQRLRFYALRRRAPDVQPLLREAPYQLPNRRFRG